MGEARRVDVLTDLAPRVDLSALDHVHDPFVFDGRVGAGALETPLASPLSEAPPSRIRAESPCFAHSGSNGRSQKHRDGLARPLFGCSSGRQQLAYQTHLGRSTVTTLLGCIQESFFDASLMDNGFCETVWQ